MAYAEALPCSSLQSLVECYWASTAGSAAHRVLPDGAIDIVVLGGTGAIVVGTMTRAFVTPRARAAVGVRFRAGEAARLLREAPEELTDDRASLSDLWGAGAREIEDAIATSLDEHHTAEHHLAIAAPILDRVLRARLASHGAAVDVKVRAATTILAGGGSVREAAYRVALSERQLGRRFTHRVGVAPKLFARVLRLQRAAAALAAGAPLSQAAEDAGYADQPHFTRDATELALTTPSALARELSDSFKTPPARER